MPVNSFDEYPLSWKPDRKTLKAPLSQSLAADLEEKIRTGLLKPGTRLPPQREIADYLDLHYSTITAVYDACKEKGLIYGVTGKGTFVSAHPTADSTLLVADDTSRWIDLGALNSFSEYSEYTEKAARQVIEKGGLRHLLEYSNPNGHPHQLAAGVRWMEQLGIHTDMEHTIIVTGAQNGLTVALLSLFSPGDKIATDQYTYANFIELAKLMQLTLIPIEGDEEGMLPEDLRSKCSSSQIKGIYLIPSSTNPTGISLPLKRRQALAEVIAEKKLLLIEDDIASWMAAAAGQVIPSIHDLIPEQCVYICGVSKSLCPGLRIAYLVFPEKYRKQILHGLFNINVKTSSLDAEIITELILSGDAYRQVMKKYHACEKATRIYLDFFPAASPADKQANFYKWLPIQSDQPYEELEGALLNRGVRVFHSDRFSVLKEPSRRYLRVSISSAGSMARLKKGLSILQQYLSEP